MAGFRLYEAANMGDMGENDAKHESFQLLGALDFCHFGLQGGCARSNRPRFLEGPSRDHSVVHIS